MYSDPPDLSCFLGCTGAFQKEKKSSNIQETKTEHFFEQPGKTDQSWWCPVPPFILGQVFKVFNWHLSTDFNFGIVYLRDVCARKRFFEMYLHSLTGECDWILLLWEQKASVHHAVTSSPCPLVCLLSASAVQHSLEAAVGPGSGARHPLHLCFTVAGHDLLGGVLLDHVSVPACFDQKGVNC